MRPPAPQHRGHRGPLAKNLFVKSFGCQMNAYDAARMADVMALHGYVSVDRPEEADLIVLNTCHIREKAAEKVYSELGRLRALKAKRRQLGTPLIAVGGCVGQAEGDEIFRRAPYVDIVFGPQTYHRLPEMAARATRALERQGGARAGGARVLDTEFPVEVKFDHLPEQRQRSGVAAILAVQEGCDKFCTFCVVPYTRGAEYSRPLADVLGEAGRLVEGGAREITLLGQNVNAYHGEGPGGQAVSLGELIRRLAEIDGLWRLRYTTSHPLEFDADLIAAHRDVATLMPFVHLPLQSGSDRILAAMNRRHSFDAYRRIVDRVRAARSDIALSSDFIVGYPGECDADFEATLAAVGEIGYAQAFSFKYSPRPGTPAAALARQVPEPVKADRLSALRTLLDGQQRAFNAALVDTEVAVLFVGPGRHPGQLVGRSPYLQAVHVTAPPHMAGRLAAVRIEAARANSLAGRLIDAQPAEAAAA